MSSPDHAPDAQRERVMLLAGAARDEALAFAGCKGEHAARALASGLLPALHSLQAEFGCISAWMIEPLAGTFNISQAEVRGVVSFYHDFRNEPAGRRVLKICRAEACQAMGCETLITRLKERHALTPGETSADSKLTIEAVYCLGNCALGPAALLDGEPVGRLDPSRLDQLVQEVRR